MTDTLATVTVADVERRKLQKHFGRFDILFFLVCTIVGVETVATVAQGGGFLGIMLGLLFLAAGAGRLYLVRGDKR